MGTRDLDLGQGTWGKGLTGDGIRDRRQGLGTRDRR